MKALVILGPTAVGKTAIAEIAAQKLDGEIISADSRQVYRGMSIGTAKPISQNVLYHLLDIIEPAERYDAARFVEDAAKAINNISSRNRVPIIVGGTGLYIRSLTAGLFPGNFRDSKISEELKIRRNNGEDLYQLLLSIDPVAAQKIDPHNHIRIERALEVYYISGNPISFWWETATRPPTDIDFIKIGLNIDRKILCERIEARIQAMLQAGWIDEVKALLDNSIPSDAPGFSSIGYRSVVAHIQGKLDFDEMIVQITKETKHYAKRQMTWFRREPNVMWLDVTNMQMDKIVQKIEAIWKNEC